MNTLQDISLTAVMRASLHEHPELTWVIRVLISRRLEEEHRRQMRPVMRELLKQAELQACFKDHQETCRTVPTFTGLPDVEDLEDWLGVDFDVVDFEDWLRANA